MPSGRSSRRVPSATWCSAMLSSWNGMSERATSFTPSRSARAPGRPDGTGATSAFRLEIRLWVVTDKKSVFEGEMFSAGALSERGKVPRKEGDEVREEVRHERDAECNEDHARDPLDRAE